MSDSVIKPEEQQAATGSEAPKIEDVHNNDTALTTEEVDKPVESAPEANTKVEDQKKVEEEVKEEKPEPKAITHGTLSKTHGGLLSFFKQKRFFYFQDDAIAEEKLKTYLHKENANKANAAHAIQTGKGLWFYSKEESQKDIPHGIIKLAEVSDVVSNAANKFVLRIPTGDLHFEAPPTERDSWVFTLKGKVADAKASEEAIVESEVYKAALEKLRKPLVGATVKSSDKMPEKTDEVKEAEQSKQEPVDKPEAVAAPEAAVLSEDEAVSSDVKRSMSKKGKRSSSVFAMFGKKDKAEEKKEDTAKDGDSGLPDEVNPTEVPTEVPTETPTPVVANDTIEPVVDSKVDEEVQTNEESKSNEDVGSLPKNTKRHSFFGSLFKKEEAEKKDKEEKKEKEERKEEHTEEPAKDVGAAPNTSDAEASKVDIATEAPSTEKTASTSPPKTKFLSNIFEKKDKSASPRSEEEPSKDIDEAQPEIKVDVPTETSTEGPKEVATSPEETAETATTPKEKRKSSFFSSFKKEKKADEKKTEDVKSDTEDVDSSTKPSTSPVPKGLLTGLMRKASRSKSSERKTEAKDVIAPATVAEEPVEAEAEASTAAAQTAKTEETHSSDKPSPAIGDVVPDAVTVGQERTAQSSA